MHKAVRSLFLAATCAVMGCSPEDTGRVSLKDWEKAHPEFSGVDFSAIGKLFHGDEFACSAVLLEPGNIIATAQHCVRLNNPGLKYSFVTQDAAGQSHTIPLPVHGTRQFQYLHVPKSHPILDIAFFQLTTPAPEEIKPATIAPEQESEVYEVFFAGYSRFVRETQGNDDNRLSITRNPCHQERSDEIYASTCFSEAGDSGGASFLLQDSRIQVTSIHHTRVSSGDKYIHDLLKKIGISYEFTLFSQDVGLAQMRDFCLESMGPEYCSGFPAPAVK